jgi:hypothetical protein
MRKFAGILMSVALSALTIQIADGAPLRDHSKHTYQQNHPGYAASSVDKGAECRAQVRQIWPSSPTIYGGGDRPLETLFSACMENGGKIP